MAVKITTNVDWQKIHANIQQQGLLRFVTDVHRLAVIKAPVKDSHLRNSGRVMRIKDGYKVRFGGTTGGYSVPYARIHEYGGWTGRGHRTYITEKSYLRDAAKQAVKKAPSYFAGKGKI